MNRYHFRGPPLLPTPLGFVGFGSYSTTCLPLRASAICRITCLSRNAQLGHYFRFTVLTKLPPPPPHPDLKIAHSCSHQPESAVFYDSGEGVTDRLSYKRVGCAGACEMLFALSDTEVPSYFYNTSHEIMPILY